MLDEGYLDLKRDWFSTTPEWHSTDFTLTHSIMAFSRCPAPFLLESDFPAGHGDVDGRFCSSIAEGLPSCCLPCPAEEWFYSDNIRTLFKAVEGISIGSLVCCAVLLLSYAVLPVEYTSRHYLSICLVASIFVMTVCITLHYLLEVSVLTAIVCFRPSIDYKGTGMRRLDNTSRHAK